MRRSWRSGISGIAALIAASWLFCDSLDFTQRLSAFGQEAGKSAAKPVAGSGARPQTKGRASDGIEADKRQSSPSLSAQQPPLKIESPGIAPRSNDATNPQSIGAKGTDSQQPSTAIGDAPDNSLELLNRGLEEASTAINAAREATQRLQRQSDHLRFFENGNLALKLPNSEEYISCLLVPAGTFQFGYSDADMQRLAVKSRISYAGHNSNPAVMIKVGFSFFMADREVTEEQWSVYKRALTPKPSDAPAKTAFAVDPKQPPTLDRESQGMPVVNVSWKEAQGFCDWLSRATQYDIRMPTEIEWEYAARGPWEQPYPWPGESLFAWGAKTGVDAHRRALVFPCKDVSWRGLFDLSGNVSEWCVDRYRQDLHQLLSQKASGQVFDYSRDFARALVASAIESKKADGKDRTYRGGSFRDTPANCEVSIRRWHLEDDSSPQVGFRPILLLPMTPRKTEKE